VEDRILIVDDEPHIRRILRYLLEQQGYVVEEASNGQMAIDMVEGGLEPDLMLLDLMMPHMDGFEVCERLRQSPGTAQLPVIMVTAKGEVTDRIRGLQGGANDYLTKPYDNKELLARVHNLLQWSRSQRDANPLTGLPGNQAIEAKLQECIANHRSFAFMYVDIDHFKAFNDCYGYHRGDELIRFTANLLHRCTEEFGDADDFVGHIGGDDFCVISSVEKGEEVGEAIALKFEEESPGFVDEEHLRAGHIPVRSRQGDSEFSDLPSVTVALVLDEGGEFEHWARVSDAAAELKSYGKSLAGNSVVRERRRPSAMQPADATTPGN
jgi:PleD family two-component response regulator